jgi:transcriptional regulator with XRE-family HTH domain
MTTMTFADWLQKQLRRRELRQADLARMVNVHPGVVSTWASGKRTPSVPSCYAIADALDLSPAVVLDRAGHPTDGDHDDEVEERLLAMWRRLTPDGQDAVMQFVEFQRGRER